MKRDMSKFGNKSKNAVAAVIILTVLSGVLGGCGKTEETTVQTSSDETAITADDTDVSEETNEDSVTRGELEGQTDYMVLRSDYNDATGIPRRVIEDISEIEDLDIRELAESYMGQGYDIYDQEAELASWQSLGDDEYMFRYGFYAACYTDDSLTDLWTYKMNETLFNYYMRLQGPNVEVEDDGTVIRCIDASYSDSAIAEYNRDTGFGTYINVTDLTLSTNLNDDLSVIESDAVRSAAEDYLSQGYDIYYLDVVRIYGDCFGTSSYPYPDGITVLYWGESYYQADIFEMDEDLFDSFIGSEALGEVISEEDDGTVISVSTQITYDDFDDVVSEYAIVFDRSTGLVSVTFIEEEINFAAPFDEDYYLPINDDLSVIDDDGLRALAQDYANDDYDIYRLDPPSWFLFEEYEYAGGFSGVYQDGTVLIDVYVFEADEELLEELLDKSWYGDEQSLEDDGNVITGIYRDYIIGNNGRSEVITTIEFDRDTGYITISTESPYVP